MSRAACGARLRDFWKKNGMSGPMPPANVVCQKKRSSHPYHEAANAKRRWLWRWEGEFVARKRKAAAR